MQFKIQKSAFKTFGDEEEILSDDINAAKRSL